MKKPIIASLLLLVFTVVCITVTCKHEIHDGIIIQKRHEPERTYTYIAHVHIGKTTMLQPRTVHDDEDWVVVVRKIVNRDTITEDFYITKQDWECMEIGSNFNDTIQCFKNDEK
jgi:hypothetical protein